MTYLSKDDIWKVEDRETRDVPVPEWGGVVRVRALSGTERDRYDASRMERLKDGTYVPSLANSRAKLVALSIVDEDGNLLFTEYDVNRLGLKSAAALTRVADVASELSGLGLPAAEELGKDSDTPGSVGSGSNSPNG